MGDTANAGRLPARRLWHNRLTRWVVALGGAAVIGAIALIFMYLLWVVAPILIPGSIDTSPTHRVGERSPILVDVSENGEAILRIAADGVLEFYDQASGAPIAAFSLGQPVVDARRVYPFVDIYAVRIPDDRILLLRTQYIVSFDEGDRVLTPKLDFPFGNAPIAIGTAGEFDIHLAGSDLVIATADGNQLRLLQYRNVEPGLALGKPREVAVEASIDVKHVFLGPRNEWLYLVSEQGEVEILGIKPISNLTRLYVGAVVASGRELTAATALLGRYSLVIADSSGVVTQWGIFKDASGQRFEPIRQFELERTVESLIVEPRRKGFAALSADGHLSLLYPTSNRIIADIATSLEPGIPMAISPRSDLLVAAPQADGLASFVLHNEHPEISWGTLWRKIWYEGYQEPVFSWQSSSAETDFEPKFSLTPLAFGTLKAAFYALLFAVPISIMGAIYTAYFMAPAMRAWVKPGIEIMAALPTVILGFIGGLWLAPIIESNLSSVITIAVVLPFGLFALALLWSQIPEKFTNPWAGWYGLIVSPLIVITVYIAFDLGPVLEDTFFDGDSRSWFREVMGLNYDQRNALVVGLIMGLAVIPTIFSIAEDAIYGVPTHLINGSLALGATPWQTLVRVVLLTASPGIFSAVMIGMGRAVGETMIVLMATGNTPLMDFNIFEGMRTFAANIAVELPESEVDSTHYRILFLAALVLFILTFIFNTAAEVVRQRLRERYGSL
jgi:phosphate transport system permease protein